MPSAGGYATCSPGDTASKLAAEINTSAGQNCLYVFPLDTLPSHYEQ
jgi:hypothetical protein